MSHIVYICTVLFEQINDDDDDDDDDDDKNASLPSLAVLPADSYC